MILSKETKEQSPSVGDYKFKFLFAWWPTKVDGFTVWLERYKIVYEYRVRDRVTRAGGRYFTLKNIPSWDLIARQRK